VRYAKIYGISWPRLPKPVSVSLSNVLNHYASMYLARSIASNQAYSQPLSQFHDITCYNVIYKPVAHTSKWPTPPNTRSQNRTISQPQITVFGVAIYTLVACHLGHVHAVCSANLHILHLRTTRCGRSAAASAAPSTAPFWTHYMPSWHLARM